MYGYGFRPNNRLFSGGGATKPLWDGLLAYYTADNTPNDSTGNGNNGTLVNGATYGTGIINNAFSLDGVNDYVDLGNNFNFNVNNTFSFNFWIDRTTGSAYSTLFSKIDSSLKGYSIRLDNNINGKIQFQMSDNLTNISSYITTNQLANLNTHMITISYDGLNTSASCVIYVDGALVASSRSITGTGASLITNINTAKIGVNSFSGGVHYYKGILDEISIYNRVITPTEVTELYNSGSALQYPN